MLVFQEWKDLLESNFNCQKLSQTQWWALKNSLVPTMDALQLNSKTKFY